MLFHTVQLFPYHLSDYLCRVARITPFKYYLDMMITILKDERSYDRVPNFTVCFMLLHSSSEGMLGVLDPKPAKLPIRTGGSREGKNLSHEKKLV